MSGDLQCGCCDLQLLSECSNVVVLPIARASEQSHQPVQLACSVHSLIDDGRSMLPVLLLLLVLVVLVVLVLLFSLLQLHHRSTQFGGQRTAALGTQC